MSQKEMSDIDHLAAVDERTNNDGTVNATIEQWTRTDSGNHVDVVVEIISETATERMRWPEPGGDLNDYKFYRLISNCGYELRNADLLEGEDIRIEKRGASWEIVAPKPAPSLHERQRSVKQNVVRWLKNANILSGLLTTLWIVFVLGMLLTLMVIAI